MFFCLINYGSIVKLKVVPFPGTESAHIEPFICSMIFLLMLKPRPEPYLFRAKLSTPCPKTWKSFLRSLEDIPEPVS